jgi:two-component system, cell cycle sensor histidine kinase and response regulator CckA
MNNDTERRLELIERVYAFRKQLEEIKKHADGSDGQREDNVFLDSLLENIPDSIYFKDVLSRFILINNAHAALLGVEKPQDAYGKTDFDFYDAIVAQSAYADEQYIITTGKPIINKRERLILFDGTYRWVSATKVPLRDSNGKIIGIVGITRDITDEKREEDKIGESESRIRRLLTDSSDVISILDRKGGILYESPSAARVLGTDDRKPRIGTNIFGFCHPEDLKQVIINFTELVQKPLESRKLVFRFRRADGTWILLESICRNLLDDPAINGIIVSSRDITDRKRTEDRIKMFEHVVRGANDSIVIADLQNYILFINQSFCDVYGYSSEEIIGEHISILWSSKNPRELIDTVFPETCTGNWEGELFNRTKEGVDFPVHLSTSVIKDDTGNPIAVAGIMRDITKQKQMEEQLRQSQKMESISVLVGGIAHNFNNILGVIMGYASLLEDPKLDREKLNRNVGIITETAERGAHLVHQLMTYIKKSPIRFEDVPANDMVNEMCEMVMQTFPKTITFSIELDSRNPVIHADRSQIRQVLFNFLLNARDAMPEGGNITVQSTVIDGRTLEKRFVGPNEDAYVCISVNDTGIGMDAEVQSRVFDPFFTTKDIGKGVGLGLSMVLGIVESHNGFVDVESSVERGSTFSVFIPLSRFETQAASTDADPEAVAAGGGAILVVEDEIPMQELLRDVLRDNGYNVKTASDGLEAIDIFESEYTELDAVILDIGLPRQSGYQTFLKMRDINADIPVIIASGFNDPDARLAVETAGARLFIQKPYTFSHILKVVSEVIASERKRG